jgi:hypothetical protein
MINDKDIEFQFGQGSGKALVWTIDGDCLYDLPLNNVYADMFLSVTDILDVSDEYPDNEGITVRLVQDGNTIEDFNTSEYFGSILLSDPQVLNLADYPYGRYVESPYAKFDGEKFIILNQDATELLP